MPTKRVQHGDQTTARSRDRTVEERWIHVSTGVFQQMLVHTQYRSGEPWSSIHNCEYPRFCSVSVAVRWIIGIDESQIEYPRQVPSVRASLIPTLNHGGDGECNDGRPELLWLVPETTRSWLGCALRQAFDAAPLCFPELPEGLLIVMVQGLSFFSQQIVELFAAQRACTARFNIPPASGLS